MDISVDLNLNLYSNGSLAKGFFPLYNHLEGTRGLYFTKCVFSFDQY